MFRKTKQGETETIDNFIVRLSKLAVSCEFAGDQKNDMIRDQIVDVFRIPFIWLFQFFSECITANSYVLPIVCTFSNVKS
jgi:hypothetical protein